MKPCVVMRSHNDMPLVGTTLEALHRSARVFPFELIVFDNASSDGTLEEVKKYADRVVHVPQGKYVPGRILNQAMEASTGEFVAFLNSDCTPCHDSWLERLLAGFSDERVAAVFGRQIPRPDCDPLFAKDTEDTYGDGVRQAAWRHCFSMALSAIRRSTWNSIPFNESIQYSEDIEWSWRARQDGLEIRYVPDSVVMHSHNYTLRQFYRRQYGEGRAEAAIFEWDPWQRSLLRYSLLPYGRQVLGDAKYCLPRLMLRSALKSPALRMAQLLGRRAGFRRGMRERRWLTTETRLESPNGLTKMTSTNGWQRDNETPWVLAGHATPDFNRYLWSVLERLARDTEEALGHNLLALILGGGYGRGEGGVITCDGTERPYNDVDLVLVVNDKRAVPNNRLSELSSRYGDELQIHVDFSRPLTLADIRRWPCSLMWFDLVHGNKILSGPSDILTANVPPRLAGPIPPVEATRLLLNRGAGLLWATRVVRGVERAPDPDFVRRNFYKCALALGDALLLAFGRYSVQYTGRDRRVRQLLDETGMSAPWGLVEFYEQALAFKFSPDSLPPGEWNRGRLDGLARLWGQVFLVIEKRRDPSAPSTMDDYMNWWPLREPELGGLRNWLPNLGRNIRIGSLSVRYPRESLYRRLPVLLGLTSACSGDWTRDSTRFLAVWKRYN